MSNIKMDTAELSATEIYKSTSKSASEVGSRSSSKKLETEEKKKDQIVNVRYTVKFNKQQKSDFNEAFDLFDATGCGLVQRDYLKVAFRALGIEPSRKDLRDMALLPSYLSFEEFLEQLRLIMLSQDELNEVIKTFQIFDMHRTGIITIDELREIARILGEDVCDQELQEMVDEGDVSGEKGVEFEEFRDLLQRTFVL